MNLAELQQRAFPFAQLQQQMLDAERRIRDLIDSPAVRIARECEAARARHLAEFDDYSRSGLVEALRFQKLLEPSRLLAEQHQVAEQNRIAELVRWTNPIEDLTRKLAEIDQVGAVYRRINETAVSRMQEVSRVITAAQQQAAILPNIGAIARQLEESTSAIIKSVMPAAMRDYSAVAAGFEAYIAAVGIAADVSFATVPQRELFVTADMLAGLSGRAISRVEVEFEPKIIRRSIDLYVYETLDEALTDFAPTLLPALEGARQIAVSSNPEKIRYACVSLRTVTLGVLELLAPTEEIKKWSARPRDFFNGRPRTLARLRFIAEHIDCPDLARFMDADSRAICELIDVLHAGTHEFGFDLNRRQLRYVFRRVESFVCALLETTMS